jgi:hypothetical protein
MMSPYFASATLMRNDRGKSNLHTRISPEFRHL